MPAGLSSSTLNLKFMQRAAARTPTSAPSTPGPSTSTPVKPDVTPTVSTPQPDGSDTPIIASEEPYRWKIDRAARPAQPAMLIPASVGPKFETSYMPFMDQEPATEAGPSRSRNGGGGRMTFGFVEPEQEDVDEDLENGDEDATQEDDDVVINVRESGKETKKHGRTQSSSLSRGFLRPRSRSPPPRRADSLLPSASKPTKPTTSASTTSANKRTNDAARQGKTDRSSVPVKQEPSAPSTKLTIATSGSTKNRPADIEVKQEPSSQSSSRAQHRKDLESKNKKKRKQSQTSHTTDPASIPKSVSQNDKKPRLEPSLLNDHPSQSSQPNSAGRSTPITTGSTVNSSIPSPTKAGVTIDERESALKAQRQKEKRARKKAKRAAGKAE